MNWKEKFSFLYHLPFLFGSQGNLTTERKGKWSKSDKTAGSQVTALAGDGDRRQIPLLGLS
ncbi:unnamed protein product [Linum tenue]|uniref:Uncharacterized protein n=1 Tax=Linum tenue TaxID=586396 RepID=A0AAV0HVI1_9ROSI|nr:unnamed protein product [Linum tenue]